jgi:hypothetical protein
MTNISLIMAILLLSEDRHLTYERNTEIFVVITIVILFFLISFTTQIYAGEKVSWKMFKEKNDVFTIKYPSNWAFGKYYEESSAPINIYFYYQGSSALAELAIYAQESLFTNSSDLVDSYPVYLQNEPEYKILETTQCGKYIIKNLDACDITVTYRDTRLEDEPVMKHVIIGTIDEDGVQYIIEYFVTEDLYEHYLPVAEEMIKSFNVTGNPEFSEDETSPPTPDLPPLLDQRKIETI